MTRLRRVTLLALVLALPSTSCGSETGSEVDGGEGVDASTRDASSGPPSDAGPRPDGGDGTPLPIGCDPGPVRGGRHAYFESLAARPDCLAVYSLRDPRQLARRRDGGYSQSNDRPLAVTYDPEGDPDPRRQDAAKVVIEATRVSLGNQVRLPIPLAAPLTSSFLITWDAWFGSEMRYDHTLIQTYKNFQISSGTGQIWTEVRSRFQLASRLDPPAIARVDVRQYAQAYAIGPGGQAGAELNGVNYGSGVLGPMVGEFTVAPETWTRYWASFEHVLIDGVDYWAFSLWVADVTRDPVLVIDGSPIRPAAEDGRWGAFWLEYNTSSSDIPAGRGELVSYARNVVMLRDQTGVAAILTRPEP